MSDSPPNGTSSSNKSNGHIKKDTHIVDPFTNNVLSQLTPFKKIQIAFMTVFVVPFRLVLVLLDLLALWLVGHWITLGQTEEDKKEPVKGWRKHIGYPIAKFFSRGLFFLGGFHWITVKGEPDMNVPIMVFAPHSGFFDSLLVVYLNFVSVIGRAGADEVFIFGNLTKLCQPIIVDRDQHKSRLNSVNKVKERVASKLGWPPLSVYPEGTCTNRKVLVLFKSGAFIPGLPVQPVCIKYGDNDMDTVSWTWEGPHPFTLCWLLLCQLHLPIEFNFLPVYHPSSEEKQNAELFAENVRTLMSKELDIPLSDLCYDDGRFRMMAKKHKLKYKIGDIKVNQLRKKYGVITDKIFELENYFASLADRKTGLCHLDGFASNLGLKLGQSVSKLFEIFDLEKCGNITLARFMTNYFEIVYMQINNTKESEIKNILNSFDKFKSDNHFSRDEFTSEIKQIYNLEIEDIEKFLKLKPDELNISKDLVEKFLGNNLLIVYLISKCSN